MGQRDLSSHRRAREDFLRANRAARLRSLWAAVTGQHNSLIPFEDLRRTLGLISQRYRGVQPVPLDKIIGSMGRSRDFDRVFLPTQRHSQGKWLSIDRAHIEGISLPPVSLYKVGDAYFVVDGHHRVSVARQQGQSFIDAEVIELQSRVPVSADLTVDDLDKLAAYREFLEQTRLDTLRPDQDLQLSMPGDYRKLLDHIRVHKYYVETERSAEMDWEEAVTHWYDHVYLPLVEAIRENGLLEDFPGHTEADLYIWMIEHAHYLSERFSQQITPWEVARDYVRRFGQRGLWSRLRRFVSDKLIPDALDAGPRPGAWREERVQLRGDTHLFRDILVTVTGAETGWRALTQAFEFARREGSVLHGLHVAANDSSEAQARGREVLEEFAFRCQSMCVRSTTKLEVGRVDEQILEHSRWVDMVVINQRREHGRWAERPLGTIFQTVAAQSFCPILAVPGTEVSPLRSVMLAYDGSPKAREALFVFKHLVHCWRAAGTIINISGSPNGREMLDAAWRYSQEDGEVTVNTRHEAGPVVRVLLDAMEEDNADLLLMGGFGFGPLVKAFLGSTVDGVLREAWFPVLICR